MNDRDLHSLYPPSQLQQRLVHIDAVKVGDILIQCDKNGIVDADVDNNDPRIGIVCKVRPFTVFSRCFFGIC